MHMLVVLLVIVAVAVATGAVEVLRRAAMGRSMERSFDQMRSADQADLTRIVPVTPSQPAMRTRRQPQVATGLPEPGLGHRARQAS